MMYNAVLNIIRKSHSVNLLSMRKRSSETFSVIGRR